MSDPASPPSLPTERSIPPYQPVRCPAAYDAQKLFLETSPRTILFGDAGLGPSNDPNRPLRSFLAPARFEGRTLQGRVVYDLSAIEGQDPRPLDYLPASEIAAFRSAAERFLDPARDDGPLPLQERALRQHLVLPDPDLEPEAYWTYGPENDRRLLILWGVEEKRGTSLPPIGHPALPGGATATVADKLRETPPAETQRHALRDILETGHPLKRFLAVRQIGADGKPVLKYAGKTFPERKAKPFSFLHAWTFKAFASAARDFQGGNLGDPGSRDASQSLRATLRVPRFHKQSPHYRNLGSALNPQPVAVLPPDFDPSDGIPLVSQSKPKPNADPLAADEPAGEPGLVEAWRPYVMPAWLSGGIAAVAVAVVLALVGLGYYSLDSVPPGLAQDPLTPGERTVRLVFDEPLREWLDGDEEPETVPRIEIRAQGRRLPITTTALLDGGHVVELELAEAMNLGGEYQLSLEGMRDTSVRGNRAPLSETFFTYAPTPVLKSISAGRTDTQLELVFNTPIDRGSLSSAYFAVDGLDLRERVQLRNEREVILESTQSLEPGGEYGLTAEGVVSALGREMEPVEGRTFRFKDNRPPVVTAVEADIHPTLTILTVDERLAEASLLPEAVRLSVLEGELTVHQIGLNANDSAEVIVLHDPILTAGGGRPEVTITLLGLRDEGGNSPVFAGDNRYQYRGRPVTSPPEIGTRQAPEPSEPVVVYFEGPWERSALQEATYRLRLRDAEDAAELAFSRPPVVGYDVPSTPITLRSGGSMLGTEVTLDPQQPLDELAWYTLEISGARGPYGLAGNDQPIVVQFQTSGVRTPVQNFVSAEVAGENRREITLRLTPDRLIADATNPDNYVLEPAREIVGVSARPGRKPDYTDTVVLELADPLAPQQTLQLRRMQTEEGPLGSPPLTVEQPPGANVFEGLFGR